MLPLEIARELQVRVTRSAIKRMYWYFAYRREEGCSFNISLIRRDVDGDKAEVHRGKVYFQSKQAGRGCVNTSDGISALKCTQHYHQTPSHKIFEIKTRFCFAIHFVLCFQTYILMFVRMMFLQSLKQHIIRGASISWFQIVSQSVC